jgi:DNA-binding beta-propeller fold protein YncE
LKPKTILIFLVLSALTITMGCVDNSKNVSDKDYKHIQENTPTLKPTTTPRQGLFGLPIYLPGINMPAIGIPKTNPSTKKEVVDTSVQQVLEGAIYSPDNSTIYMINHSDQLLYVLDSSDNHLTRKVFLMVDEEATPVSLEISDAGDALFVLMSDGKRLQFDTNNFGSVKIL